MKLRIGKKPWIVGCIGSESLLRRCVKKAPVDCDVLEVRLDLTGLCGGEWIRLCAAIRKHTPVLLTIRSESQGGQWVGREAERLALYLAGLKSVSAVDIEIGAPALEILVQPARRHGVLVIASCHDFEGTPELDRLRTLEERGRRMGGDVVKIATMANHPAELARLLAVPSQATGPISVMGMGKWGGVSRIALPCAGSCMVYGSLGPATAPGQMSCRQLNRELTRWGAR